MMRKYLILAGLYIGLLAFLMSNNPKNAPIALLLIPFVWLFTCLLLTFMYMFDRFQPSSLIHRRSKVLAITLSLLPVLMLLLKSIDQLSAKDGILIVILVFSTVFYATKLRFNQPNS